MNVLELSLVLMLLLFAILGSGVWIALALAVCGFAAVMTKVATPAGQVLAALCGRHPIPGDLTALPMFIWMGEISYPDEIARLLFRAGAPGLQRRTWVVARLAR